MLFDRDECPDLSGMTDDDAWKACEDFEDYVYNIADDVSEDRFDSLICAVRRLYDRYYQLFEV